MAGGIDVTTYFRDASGRAFSAWGRFLALIEIRADNPSKAWTAVVLVFLFMLINFADKAVIGLASVPIMRDLRLDHRQFGLLGSAFFLLFSVSGVVVGFLA